MIFKNLILVTLIAAILVFNVGAAPSDSSIRLPRWEAQCRRHLVLFAITVCGHAGCGKEVSRIGCQRKLFEEEMKSLGCAQVVRSGAESVRLLRCQCRLVILAVCGVIDCKHTTFQLQFCVYGKRSRQAAAPATRKTDFTISAPSC